MYEVYVERTAQRALRRLPPEDFQRVIAAVKALADNPRPPGSRKIVGSKSDCRIRLGTVRVIYEVADDAKAVRVLRVAHRREAYR